MPTGNIPGWNQVYADDFNGTSLDSGWGAYWGEPGGDPNGFWDPTHVTVSGGQLVLSAYQDSSDDPYDAGPNTYVSGGVKSTFAQTYGKYEVRMREPQSDGVTAVAILWPADNSWPPEIDYAETDGLADNIDWTTLHYGADNTQVGEETPVNFSDWHTYGVEWSPGKLVYTLDGNDIATVDNANVPDIPMVMTLQQQGWCSSPGDWGGCPNGTTPSVVDMDVDWVVAYAPAS